MKIEKSAIKYLQKRRRDDVGEIFEYDGKILRGIFPHTSSMVKGMFESGFIPELIKKELFPNSWITEYTNDDYGLIVEHQRIWPIIYPQEWSFNMLKDAALNVLEVAKIARHYGYNMKDCHGFNVLIENNKPKFIDLGSFHTNKDGVTGWGPYQEFLKFYYYPLFTWKDGLEYTSKLSIFSANLTPHIEHYIYKYKLARYLPTKFLEKLIKLRFLVSNISCNSNSQITQKINNKNPLISSVVKILKSLSKMNLFLLNQDLDSLENKIKKLNRKEVGSQWKNYHSNISKKKDRFDDIIFFVNEYCPDIRTAIDIAGNQGVFSKRVLAETNVENIIVQDLDEQAIDIGYRRYRNQKVNISFVNYNFIAPIIKTTHPVPRERFQSDIVFALALLHHLILTQGFALEDIIEELGKYSKKYVCVEFIPRGLWVYADGDKVNIPDWYTVDWFREEFVKYFEILKEKQIAENYIVFIGKKRA